MRWIGIRPLLLFLWIVGSCSAVQDDPGAGAGAVVDPDIKELLGESLVNDTTEKVDDGGGGGDILDIKQEADQDPGPNLMDEEDEDEKSNGNGNETVLETDEQVFLPEEGSAEKEHSNSLAIFFVLSVLILCVFLVHFALQLKCHYIPESLAIVFLGAIIGLSMKILPVEDLKKVESFSPTMFFLVLLPPIIFESGYNLHKGESGWFLLG